jgi:hypothetical protein
MQGQITFCAVVALYTGNSSKHLLTMIDQGIAAAMPSASIQMIEFRAADPTTKKVDGWEDLHPQSTTVLTYGPVPTAVMTKPVKLNQYSMYDLGRLNSGMVVSQHSM